MFSVTSLGFLPFMALFVCLWYRVPQPSRWKLFLAANAVFCLSIDIGAFFAVALATAVVWQAAQHAQPEQPSRRGWLALGLAAALLPLLLLTAAGCATTRTTTQTSDIQTRIHSERSVEKSQRDSLARQLRQRQQESDSTSRTLLIATESLPTDRTRLAIPLKDLDHLPPGAAYTARSGRAAIRAEKQDDSLVVTGISDRAERRTWLLTNQTFRRQRQSDSLASHTGLRNLSSFACDTTLLRETHASTTRKKSSGNLFRTLFTGIALGILLTVVFRKTGVWAAIRRFLKNLLP